MQDILVYTDNFRRPWTPAIEYAGHLAAAREATLTAAYVYPSPLYTAPRYSAPSLIEAIWRNARELEAEAQAASAPFSEWAAKIGVRRATWHVAEGYLPDALAEIGAWHDVLVLDRDDDETWGSAPDVATLVLASQLPCIAVPKGHREAAFERIVIGWNGAPEAVRAVHAALPLLSRASEVVLLRGAPRDSSLEISWKPPFEIEEHLRRHGIAFVARDLGADDESAGEALLASAKGADLLVMGAYGRTRFSEWALGGATRHVLAHAHLPVFLRH